MTEQGRKTFAMTWWDPHLNFTGYDLKTKYSDSKGCYNFDKLYDTLSY